MNDILSEVCRAHKKWGMYIRHATSAGIGPHELWHAAPFLVWDDALGFWHHERAIMLFDSEEEMREHFFQAKGEDAARSENLYDGPARVFAVTCSPDGLLMDENT